MTDEIHVCIVDDDAAILDSLRLTLERHKLTAHCFTSASEFIGSIDRGLMPACLVTDVRMPGMSGLDLHRIIQQRGSTFPVIIITGHGDIEMAVKAIKVGAFDFIEKPFDARRLIATIKEAIKIAGTQQAERLESATISARVNTLSERQRQVMDLAVQGFSNKEIAAHLRISPRTVDIYRAWVMKKTGARNLAELVRLAMKLGPKGQT